ncbi:hypothetical protein DL765_004097 [Monosporascus sp. GIB2]|nr:hypothetical protein DL765_004097 [Monosporascus sp. GIB2]
MGAATIIFFDLFPTKPRAHLIFHSIIAGTTFLACIAYFAMNSNLGQTPVAVEWQRPFRSAVVWDGRRQASIISGAHPQDVT